MTTYLPDRCHDYRIRIITTSPPEPLELSESVACPECAGPARVLSGTVLPSTDGPIDLVKIRCGTGHWFLLPAELLAADVEGRHRDTGL